MQQQQQQLPEQMPSLLRARSVVIQAHNTDRVWLNGAPAVVLQDDQEALVQVMLKSTREKIWVDPSRLEVAKTKRQKVLHQWGFPHVADFVTEDLASQAIKLCPPEGWPQGFQGAMDRIVSLIHAYWEPVQDEDRFGHTDNGEGWIKTKSIQSLHDNDKIKALWKTHWLRKFAGGSQREARFVDKDFLPNEESVLSEKKWRELLEEQGQVNSARIGWRRPEDITQRAPRVLSDQYIDQHQHWTLFRGERGGISPDDVHQGQLGDCWFLSVLSVLASKPQLVRNLIISDNDEVKTGQYIVRIAECGYWNTVRVDDLLPADPNGALMFCGTLSNELWAPIIEKAYAKLHGGYKNLEGGQISWALHELTGFPVQQYGLNGCSRDALWNALTTFNNAGYLLGLSSKAAVFDESYYDSVGISPSHAYTVLDIAVVTDKQGNRARLVKLRNPWGFQEWKGAFSDGKDFKGIPEPPADSKSNKSEAANQTGVFWISLADVLDYFSHLAVCSVTENCTEARFRISVTPDAMINESIKMQSKTAQENIPPESIITRRPPILSPRGFSTMKQLMKHERLRGMLNPFSNHGLALSIAYGHYLEWGLGDQMYEIRFEFPKEPYKVMISLSLPIDYVKLNDPSWQNTPIFHAALIKYHECNPTTNQKSIEVMGALMSHPITQGVQIAPPSNVAMTVNVSRHPNGVITAVVGNQEYQLEKGARYFLVVDAVFPFYPKRPKEWNQLLQKLLNDKINDSRRSFYRTLFNVRKDAKMNEDNKELKLRESAWTQLALSPDPAYNIMDAKKWVKEWIELKNKEIKGDDPELSKERELQSKKEELIKENLQKCLGIVMGSSYKNAISAKATVSFIVSNNVQLDVRSLKPKDTDFDYDLYSVSFENFGISMAARAHSRGYTQIWNLLFESTELTIISSRFWQMLTTQALYCVLSQPFYNLWVLHSTATDNPARTLTDTISNLYRTHGWKGFLHGTQTRFAVTCCASFVGAAFHQIGVSFTFWNPDNLGWFKPVGIALSVIFARITPFGLDLPRLLVNHIGGIATIYNTLALENRSPVCNLQDGARKSVDIVEALSQISHLAQSEDLLSGKFSKSAKWVMYLSPLLTGFPAFMGIRLFETFVNIIAEAANGNMGMKKLPPYPTEQAPIYIGDAPDIFYPLRLIVCRQIAALVKGGASSAAVTQDLLTRGGWYNLMTGFTFASLSGLTWTGCYYLVNYLWPKILIRYKLLPPRHRRKIKFATTFAVTVGAGATVLLFSMDRYYTRTQKRSNGQSV